jgi:hypothetical protein
VINPTGSVVAVVWAKVLATVAINIPTAAHRMFLVEGLMMEVFITAWSRFKVEFKRSVAGKEIYTTLIKFTVV